MLALIPDLEQVPKQLQKPFHLGVLVLVHSLCVLQLVLDLAVELNAALAALLAGAIVRVLGRGGSDRDKYKDRHLVGDVVNQVEILELLRKSRVGRRIHSSTRDYLGSRCIS